MKLLVAKVMLVITIISGGLNAQTNQMLSLSFPQQTILSRENRIGFSVTFTNNTGKTVYLLPSSDESGMFERQLIPQYRSKHYIPWDWYGENMNTNIPWTVLTNSEVLVTLSNGRTYTWDLNGLDINLDVCAKYSVTNLGFRLRIGEHDWVESNYCDIHVLNSSRDTQDAIFTTKYLISGHGLVMCNIYKDKIYDDQFLFAGSGRRICKIATNEVPSFAMNTNAAILTVTLPVSRKTVRYYPRTGRIEEEAMP